MQAESLTDNTDGTINIEENLFGQGLFPRIRDIELLDAVGDTGKAKVMVMMSS